MKFIKHIFVALVLVATLGAKEQVNINFSNLEIDEFVRLVSKITNKNILITHKIAGSVDMVSSAPVYDTELMDILISVLESKGFTLIENGSMYEVVRSNDAAKSTYKVEKTGVRVNGALMTTQVIDVQWENVDIVAAKIRYLLSTAAKLMTMKETNAILITDYPKNIETIKKVIVQIDAKYKNIVKLIPIKYTEIKKLQARLNDISKSLFNEKVDGEMVKIVLDENSNSLVLVGKEANVAKIEELIAKMDIEIANKAVQIFILKNSDVASVVASLNDIISKQTFADPSLKPNISASEEINGVIAVGDPSVISGIKLIIDELDKEKFQVYVKARIVEINKKNAENIGVKYGFAAGDVSSSGLYAMSGNFGADSLTGTASAAVLDYLGAIGSGGKSAFALGATLDFLETNGASKSVANPSILCVNNQESSIYVGKTISIVTGTVAASIGGSTNSYKREDVGLTLKIKPRVSSIDKVTLNVEAILENIIGSETAERPVTTKQEVKTQAILGQGEDIIIGGLVKSYENKSKSKVPLLGDIPWLGEWLFSSNSTSFEEDNLIVILTPYIVDKSEKLSELQKELGALASLQQEYNDIVFDKVESGEFKKTLEEPEIPKGTQIIQLEDE
ncbi:MAG: secretin N-terminal domain-containing protein [Sulfurimonas sp.]|jgi:general secretion pathway protein D|nr:secretin N-terminal domain-containing protein [Sulfurimonas sp.]